MMAEENITLANMNEEEEDDDENEYKEEENNSIQMLMSHDNENNNTGNHNNFQQQWNEQYHKWQCICIILSLLLAMSAMIVVIWWIQLLGGLSWQLGHAKQVFHWHPLGMITAFCFMTVASLSFRFQYILRTATSATVTTTTTTTTILSRPQLKFCHGMAWTVAAMCAIVALQAVWQSHNDPIDGYIANLYSFHSWMGIIVMILYLIQFLVGMTTFVTWWWPRGVVGPSCFQRRNPTSTWYKTKVLSIHTWMGQYLYMATAATILIGIQEKEGFVTCSYKVTSPDVIPLWHLYDIPLACRVSHLLGLIVLVMTMTTSFALQQQPSPSSPPQNHCHMGLPTPIPSPLLSNHYHRHHTDSPSMDSNKHN